MIKRVSSVYKDLTIYYINGDRSETLYFTNRRGMVLRVLYNTFLLLPIILFFLCFINVKLRETDYKL